MIQRSQKKIREDDGVEEEGRGLVEAVWSGKAFFQGIAY